MKRLIAGIAIVGGIGALLIIVGTIRHTDVAIAQAGSEGAAVYADNCATCHQADGSGIPGAFPPLAGNPNVADGAYVEEVVRNGRTGSIDVLGATYNSAMPPIELDDAQIAAVVTHVQFLSSATPVPATTAPPGDLVGDIERGKKLFAGSMGFENRGPACHACHAAGPLGLRGGSGLGPDLTDAASRLGGEAGLSAWLANPASPTMQPIFADKQLTESEALHVASFLASVAGDDPAGGFDSLILGGIVGFGVLLLFMALAIRGPRETYTDRLRSQS